MRLILISFLALSAIVSVRATEANQLVVHEWGTFTSLQNDYGESLGGMNNEEESLPSFVHTLGYLIQRHTQKNFNNFKGLVANRTDVTMRLETPVLYFHLPTGVKETRVDVHVKFNAGYLTQFFPIAKTIPADVNDLKMPITDTTQGGLNWNGLVLGSTQTPPDTDSGIWNAPRRVDAANVLATPVTVPGYKIDAQNKAVNCDIPQVEKYLFYRGVGKLDAPLRMTRSLNQMTVLPPASIWRPKSFKAELLPKTVWLVDIRENGTMAWIRHELKVPEAGPDEITRAYPAPALGTFSVNFPETEYSRERLGGLKQELQKALMQDGMFQDEADALLNTWEESYFKSAGLRVFFMVPQAWTDQVLPLEIKSEIPVSKIRRAMVGRIELITPAQRALAAKIVASGLRSHDYEPETETAQARENYIKLGRFRNVILLDVKNQLDSYINQSTAQW